MLIPEIRHENRRLENAPQKRFPSTVQNQYAVLPLYPADFRNTHLLLQKHDVF